MFNLNVTPSFSAFSAAFKCVATVIFNYWRCCYFRQMFIRLAVFYVISILDSPTNFEMGIAIEFWFMFTILLVSEINIKKNSTLIATCPNDAWRWTHIINLFRKYKDIELYNFGFPNGFFNFKSLWCSLSNWYQWTIQIPILVISKRPYCWLTGLDTMYWKKHSVMLR